MAILSKHHEKEGTHDAHHTHCRTQGQHGRLSGEHAAFFSGGHRLRRARNLSEALQQLNTESVDLLISDLRLAGEETAPLLKTLAQAHPQLLSLVVTPFQDTQALLRLINEAQIFRYLPKPIRPGLFEKGLSAAARQAQAWRAQPSAVVTRLAEAPKEDRERNKVGNLMGMLGRLRERLSA